ncbi:MAG: DUF2950 domain-containing protein [Bryobacteraceae bacterium]
MKSLSLWGTVLVLCVTLSGVGLAAAVPADSATTIIQSSFTTPEDAVKALAEAARTKDQAAMTKIFGPEREKLLTGDPVEDNNALEHLAAHLQKPVKFERHGDSSITVVIGEDSWPMPIPLVKAGDRWQFDTAAGLEEILNRRIGENELSTIMTCRAYVVAQWEYYTEALGTTEDGLAVYAQHFISSPAKRDGLFWETPEGGKPSPLGSLITEARAEGYTAGKTPANPQEAGSQPPGAHHHTPFHGYYLKILKAQGPHAPGGQFSYLINGNMIAGYALIAYPDKWGSSGVMTFIVNNQGRLYEKNLGPETEDIAAAISEYDPDPSWKLVKEQ